MAFVPFTPASSPGPASGQPGRGGPLDAALAALAAAAKTAADATRGGSAAASKPVLGPAFTTPAAPPPAPPSGGASGGSDGIAGAVKAMMELRAESARAAKSLGGELRDSLTAFQDATAEAAAKNAATAGQFEAVWDKTLAGVGASAERFAGIAAGANAALSASQGPLAGFRNGIDSVSEKLTASGEKAGKALAPLTDSLAGFGAAQQAAVQPYRDLRDAFQAAVGPAAAMVRSVVGFPGAVARFTGQSAAAVAHLAREPMQILQSAIGSVQSQVAGFVGKLSPIHVQRFQFAVDDLYASIGKSLLPIMDRFTSVIRVVGSMFNGLSTNGQRAIQVLASAAVGMTVFAAGAYAIQSVLTAGIGPLLGAVAGALGGVAFASGALDAAMKPLAAVMGGVLERVGEVLGMFTGGDAFASMAVAFGEIIGVAVELGALLAESLMPAFNAVAGAVQALMPAVRAVLPLLFQLSPAVMLLQVFGAAMEALGPILVSVAEAVAGVVVRMSEMMRSFLAMLGINVPTVAARRSTPQDNTGMAYKQAQTGGIEDVIRRARESAYSMGSGGESKADPVVGKLDTVNTSISDLKTAAVAAIKDLPQALAGILLNHASTEAKKKGVAVGQSILDVTGGGVSVGNLAGRAADRIRQGVPDVMNGITGALGAGRPF